MDVTKSERFEQLDRLLTEHDGMLQTAQVIASGIVKPIFYEYVKEKNLQQVAHGIYVSEDTWIDAMFLLHLRCGQAVFSHESALFFHDLTDREHLHTLSRCAEVQHHSLKERASVTHQPDYIG